LEHTVAKIKEILFTSQVPSHSLLNTARDAVFYLMTTMQRNAPCLSHNGLSLFFSTSQGAKLQVAGFIIDTKPQRCCHKQKWHCLSG
jgi:hypothetical protein